MRRLLSLSLLAVTAAAQPPAPALGVQVGALRLVDIRYVPRSLADFKDAKAFVLAFVGNDCPIARRYLPRLAELERGYRARGVVFLALNPNPADSVLGMAAQAVDQDIAFPFLKDFAGAAAAAVGATRLGQVAVLDAERHLRYRGRVDGQDRLSGAAPAAGRADLREALDEVLAGKPVSVPETEVEGCLITRAPAVRSERPAPAFHADIEPLIQRHCQDCHRPRGQAPFHLITYEDVIDHAEMIGEVVEQRRMPPWFGCPDDGPFINQRGMSADERALLQAWLDGGRLRGKPEAAPPPRQFPTSEWRIGTPDLVLRTAAPVRVVADGLIPYQYLALPHVFETDTWLQAIEIRSDHPANLHHANLVCVEKGGGYKPEGFVTGTVPGGDPMDLDAGIAFLVPKGSVFVLQAHYVTNGKEVSDHVRVALRFPRGVVHKRLHHWQLHDNRFAIPPDAPHHRVAASRKLGQDATGVGMFAHMHLRGKDMTFAATYPDGRNEQLLRIPNYLFEWQSSYHWPNGTRKFPKGTRIDVVAHFDNSTFNSFNPDPKETVRFGLETTDEMMYGFFFFTLDREDLGLRVDAKTGTALQ